MAITPGLQTMTEVSNIMAETLQDLHRFIEKHSAKNKPEETMVLMMGFCSGLIMQLKDKIETTESGMGNKFLDTLNEITNRKSKGFETIEKLSTNDPSLNISASGVDQDDLPAAISFLTGKLIEDTQIRIDELPLRLRNDNTLTYALARFMAHLFVNLDSKNVNSMIETFSENIRMFAGDKMNYQKPTYH